MAWTSNETKMDTGQLYVSSDNGKTFTKVTDVKFVEPESTKKMVCDCCFNPANIHKVYIDISKDPLAWQRLNEYMNRPWVIGSDGYIKPSEMYFEDNKINYYDVYNNSFLSIAEAWAMFKNLNKNDEKETKKMEARKCERCGKLYEVSNFSYGNDTLYRNAKNSSLVRFKFDELRPVEAEDLTDEGMAKRQADTIYIKRYKGDNKVVTLCPDCLVSLKSWWENPNPDKEDK